MRSIGACLALLLCTAGLAVRPAAQTAAVMPANDLYKVRGMMREAYETVKKNYYDPSFRGLDLESRYREYDGKLKSAPTMNAGLTLVAAFLGGLNDSHTSFLPPPHAYTIDYGYHLMVIGDNVFVERVRPGTDAAAKVPPRGPAAVAQQRRRRPRELLPDVGPAQHPAAAADDETRTA